MLYITPYIYIAYNYTCLYIQTNKTTYLNIYAIYVYATIYTHLYTIYNYTNI